MSVDVEQELERQIQALKLLIKSRNVSVREIERRLDLGAGSLNRIFAGRIQLKVRHTMMILDQLAVDPKVFYRLVYADARPEQFLAERLSEVLGRPVPQKAGALDEAAMERWMREMFSRLMAEYEAGPGTAGKKTPKPSSKKAAKPRTRPRRSE